MRYLFPERPISFDDAWNLFVDEKSGRLSNSWHTMRQALYRAHGLDYQTEITADIVDPRFDPEQFSYAWWSHFPETRYAHRLEGWLSAGWFAITEIDHSGRGPMTPDGYHNGTNHFVLLDGIKYAPTEYGKSGEYTSILPHVHVVCSNRGPYWIRVQEFIMRFGGAGWWLCRRDEREPGR